MSALNSHMVGTDRRSEQLSMLNRAEGHQSIWLPATGLFGTPCATPLETWWALEDLWIRLARAGHLSVADADHLQLPGFRTAHVATDLRDAVFDTERYGWQQGLDRGSFVRTLAYEGDDLICSLTPTDAMRRWPDGPTLEVLRIALLARLRRWSC